MADAANYSSPFVFALARYVNAALRGQHRELWDFLDKEIEGRLGNLGSKDACQRAFGASESSKGGCTAAAAGVATLGALRLKVLV